MDEQCAECRSVMSSMTHIDLDLQKLPSSCGTTHVTHEIGCVAVKDGFDATVRASDSRNCTAGGRRSLRVAG